MPQSFGKSPAIPLRSRCSLATGIVVQGRGPDESGETGRAKGECVNARARQARIQSDHGLKTPEQKGLANLGSCRKQVAINPASPQGFGIFSSIDCYHLSQIDLELKKGLSDVWPEDSPLTAIGQCGREAKKRNSPELTGIGTRLLPRRSFQARSASNGLRKFCGEFYHFRSDVA